MGLLEDLKKLQDDVLGGVPVVQQVTQTLTTTQKSAREQVEVPAKSEPATVWERIGCSKKTLEFIKMSLEDGVIDAKERAMLVRQVEADGIDPQEFDFVLTKALEAYHKMAKNVIHELSNFFKLAENMATGVVKPNQKSLTEKLPATMAKTNPYMIGSMVAVETISSTIGTFIKAPSKLNTFKAEYIRIIDIPLLPEVLVDFFCYAESQVKEEKQRNSGKGVFAKWSEALFGKDIDLVPIWMEKMTHVMTKAVIRHGNHPEVMSLIEKWRVSPLKKLKGITDSHQIENFPIPQNASDYIDLVKYSYEKGESVKTIHREAFAQLNARLLKESSKFVSVHPSVGEVIRQNRVKMVNIVMSNCDNPVFMVQLMTPEDLTDLLEVLHFLSTRKDLKKHHQRIYEEGLAAFDADPDAKNKIQQFKPKNIFGF
ncbi:MAG: tellurite resistance TerB family protein [Muribaculaceae bacterium]|nr:tellurite resistance TerB family protein [Muribaculaceae bacterium]